MGATVEYTGDRVISFLAAGVPDHHLQESFLVDMGRDRSELGPYGHLVVLGEGIRADPLNDAGFAHARISYQDQLEGGIKASPARSRCISTLLGVEL